MNVLRAVWLTALGLMATACESIELGDDYDAFQIEVVGRQFVAEGVIDETTPAIVEAAIADNPDISELVLEWVPGSADDDSNLRAARMVRASRLTTIVPEGGLVASGGTDFFLAGARRIIGPDACVGVHSWASEDGSGEGSTQGRDVPKGDEAHSPYLSFYAEMGISKDFYWYTLDAADVDAMHWMSRRDLQRFNMATEPLTSIEASSNRCDERT